MTLTPVPKSLTATFTSQVPAASATQMYPSQSSIRQNIAVITPVSTSDIKSEPVDPDDKSCLHKLLTQGPTGKLAGALSAQASASPASNRQVMPVVGHKRAPPLKVKSESVEEKWKEIEKFIHNPETSKKRRRTGEKYILYIYVFMVYILVCTHGSSTFNDECDFSTLQPAS